MASLGLNEFKFTSLKTYLKCMLWGRWKHGVCFETSLSDQFFFVTYVCCIQYHVTFSLVIMRFNCIFTYGQCIYFRDINSELQSSVWLTSSCHIVGSYMLLVVICCRYCSTTWLTHWGWVMPICIGKLITVKSLIQDTKSHNFNVSHFILQLSLPNPSKLGVKSRMKM